MDLPDISQSLALYERALQIIPGGTQLFSRRPERFAPGVCPPYVTHGLGTRVWDLDGNEYIDFLCGVGPVILGHAYPRVTEAVIAQLRKGSAFPVNHPVEVELAELLIDTVPCAEMVRLCKAGGTADEIAVRIARGHTGRDRVVFCGYHGWHDWYLAANLADDATLDGHLLPGLDIRGVPQGLRGTAIPFRYNDLESLRAALQAHRGEVAAIIMEASRTDLPAPGFLTRSSPASAWRWAGRRSATAWFQTWRPSARPCPTATPSPRSAGSARLWPTRPPCSSPAPTTPTPRAWPPRLRPSPNCASATR